MTAENRSASYVSQPDGDIRGGLVALHAWWGLNDFTRQFCDRLATEGFFVIAPDLYGGGKTASTVDQAEALASAMDSDPAMHRINGAIEQLKDSEGMDGRSIGVVGFSLGASFALAASLEPTNDVNATVIFYGTGGPVDVSRSASAYQGHFAENDPYEPTSEVEGLKESIISAGREAEFYTYQGTGHWFFESDRPDAYNPEAAALAWDRARSFLHRYVG